MRSVLPLGLLLVLGACATTQPVTISRSSGTPGDDVGRAVAFLDALPPCTAEVEKSALSVGDAQAGELPSAVSVRGAVVAGSGACTLRGCVGRDGAPAPACCNSCGGDWVLRAPDGAKESTVALLDGYDKPLLTYSVMDCKMKELQAVPPVDAVATGTLRVATHHGQAGRAELIDAHVCRVRR